MSLSLVRVLKQILDSHATLVKRREFRVVKCSKDVNDHLVTVCFVALFELPFFCIVEENLFEIIHILFVVTLGLNLFNFLNFFALL